MWKSVDAEQTKRAEPIPEPNIIIAVPRGMSRVGRRVCTESWGPWRPRAMEVPRRPARKEGMPIGVWGVRVVRRPVEIGARKAVAYMNAVFMFVSWASICK